MSCSDFRMLTHSEQREAKRLAKELLRTVPASNSGQAENPSPRWALHSHAMKPENVIAVLIYNDGIDRWWGDVVLRKGNGTIQLGTPETSPEHSYEQALDLVKSIIGVIKGGVEEGPIVQALRDAGLDPASVELLQVSHPKFGHRWIIVSHDEASESAERFAARFGGDTAFCQYLARTFILEIGQQFASHPVFLISRDEQIRDEANAVLLRHCAAFLVSEGVINIDAGGNTEDAYDSLVKLSEGPGSESFNQHDSSPTRH